MENPEETGTKESGDADQTKTSDSADTAQVTGNQDEIAGLKTAAEEERKKRQAAEAEAQAARDQMAIMQANQPPAQPSQQPLSTYEQAKADLGLSSSEYLTEAEKNQVFNRAEEITATKNRQMATQFTNQQFIDSHPDYGEVVGVQISPTHFQKSAELQKILNEKPHLSASAYSSAQAAYKIVMEERKIAAMAKEQESLKEHQAAQDVDNKTSPMSGAAAGGGGASSGGGLALNTIEDVRAAEERVAAGDFDKE